MPAPVVLGWIAAASAAVGAVSSIERQNEMEKAREAQEKQNELANKRAEAQFNRQKLQQIERARVARARIASLGAGQGVAGSSAVIGGQQGITSQLSSNLGFASQSQAISQQQFSLANQQGEALSRAGLFGGISSAASSVGSLASSSQFQSLFS